MNADFTGYQKIRVSFSGLTQPLNFNIQPYTGRPGAQGGCNIPPYAGPFSVELPLNLFTQTQGFSFADVTAMDVIFQDGSAIGGVKSSGITSIVLTNTTAAGVVIDCHYETLASRESERGGRGQPESPVWIRFALVRTRSTNVLGDPIRLSCFAVYWKG